MTTEITTRAAKGAPLTYLELDENFENLRDTADAASDAVIALGGKANASALGVSTSATNMGTFTGTIVPDNQTAKQAMQALETDAEAYKAKLLSSTALNGPNLVAWFHDATAVAGSLASAWKLRANPMNSPWNAAGDGVTDDAPEINACLTWLKTYGKGGVMDVTHPHLIDSVDVTVPRYCSIEARLGTGSVGNPSFFGHTNAYADLASAPKLIVNPARTIRHGATGGSGAFKNVIFGRKGLAYDGNDLPADYAGTAVTLTTTSGVLFENCTFLGFAKGVFSDGGSQIRWNYCQFDGLCSTHQNNGFDINTHLDCRSYNFLQSGVDGNDPRTKRDGDAYLCDGTSNGGHMFINTFAYGYRRAFNMETAGSYSFPGCWADGPRDATTGKSLWADGFGFRLVSGNLSNNAECQITNFKSSAQDTGVYVGPNVYGAVLIHGFHIWECNNSIVCDNPNVQILGGAIRGHFNSAVKYGSASNADAGSINDLLIYDRQGSPNTPVDIDCGGGDPVMKNVRYAGGPIVITNKGVYTVAPVSEFITYDFNRDLMHVSGTAITGDMGPKVPGKVITLVYISDNITHFGGPDGPSTFYNDAAAGNFQTRGPFKATAGSSITFYRNAANTKWVEMGRTLYNQSSDPGIVVFSSAGAVAVPAYLSTAVVAKGTGAATTVNLPASPLPGKRIVIKDGKGDAATNNITITPAAGTIDGAATLVLNTNYGRASLVYNGVEWNVI